MAVKQCYLCNKEAANRQYGPDALAAGEVCPVCYQPTCRNHLGTVRWRWRNNGALDSAQVCKECLRTYRHRDWDKYHRDWIT